MTTCAILVVALGAGDPAAQIERGLSAAVSVDWKENELDDVLQVLAKASASTIVLDAELPQDVRKKKIVYQAQVATIRRVLGEVLKQAGLRYTYADGGIFVSTKEKVLEKLLKATAGTEPEESGPVTVTDLLDKDGFNDDVVSVGILNTPGATPWQKPHRDAVTGIMQFPGPDVFIEDPGMTDPLKVSARMFTKEPYFLKPEYLLKHYLGGEGSERELLGRLIEVVKKHPELTSRELLDLVEKAAE